MDFTFLSSAGDVLFSRNDIEDGHWVQEEMSVNATFSYVSGKVIERGQRIAFRDPATDAIQMFEIRNVQSVEPDHYQQITAEHIAISELSDEHINATEITDKTAQEALTTALTGTLWSVGNNTASGTQSADFSRGSVWQAVGTIEQNWNVYITPRVVIGASGITGRYLDIAPAQGTWRGLRLSIQKNVDDPSVIYDDTDVYTALYGYGGSVEKSHTTGDDTTEELTFADQVWTATSSHPAKPLNQTYLEWPAKTTLYGRGNPPRARFGYYQNGSIKDSAVLLQKTWEALQQTCDPKISISGTVTDLYRLGYKDQPLRLHDLAIVEIEDINEVFQKEIIRLDIDLVNPSKNRVEIGDYIPNIIYINRDTDEKAGGGGGGGGSGKTNLEEELSKYQTWFDKTDTLIGMWAGIKDGDGYLKVGQICLAINESDEILAYINADHVNISATTTIHTLAGSIEYDANGKLIIHEGGGVYVERTNQGTTAQFGVWDRGNLTGGVMVQQINGQTSVQIDGDRVDINGSHIVINADRIDIDGVVTALASKDIACDDLSASQVSCQTITAEESISTDDISANSFNSEDVGWLTMTFTAINGVSSSHYFLYSAASGSTTPTGTATGYVVSSTSSKTIHYLGNVPQS